jgi:hypothetical protein
MADSTKKGKKLIRNTFDLMVQTKEQAFALGNCKDVGIIVVPGMNLKPAPRTPEDLNFLVGRHLHGIQI